MTSSQAESSPRPPKISSAWSQKQSTSAGSNCVPRRSVATATAAAVPPDVVEDLDVVGEVHQAHRRSDVIGARPAGHALAVPALEGLEQRGAHLLAEPELVGEVARRLAVLLHHALHRTARRREEVPDHADATHRRPATAEVARHEHAHGHRGQVSVVGVGVELLLLAEEDRDVARIGGTADPGEQGGVVGGRPHGRVDPDRVGQAHGDDGLAQHPLDRTTHPQV